MDTGQVQWILARFKTIIIVIMDTGQVQEYNPNILEGWGGRMAWVKEVEINLGNKVRPRL